MTDGERPPEGVEADVLAEVLSPKEPAGESGVEPAAESGIETADEAEAAEDTLNIPAFSNIAEVEAKGPAGTSIRARGAGTPAHLVALVLPPLLLLVGLGLAGGIIISGGSFVEGMAFLAVSVLLAAITRYAPPPRSEN